MQRGVAEEIGPHRENKAHRGRMISSAETRQQGIEKLPLQSRVGDSGVELLKLIDGQHTLVGKWRHTCASTSRR